MNTTIRRAAMGLSSAALAATGIAVTTAGPAAAAIPSQVYVDTGWTYYDGGCQARTQLYYWPASNTAQMKTSVQDPYLFVACRVNAQVVFDTARGPVTDGVSQRAMACAVLDPSCASSTTTPWQTFRPASVNLSTLQDFGVDLSQVINRVRVDLTKA